MVNLTERPSPEVSFSENMFGSVLWDSFYVVTPFPGQFSSCFSTLYACVNIGTIFYLAWEQREGIRKNEQGEEQ